VKGSTDAAGELARHLDAARRVLVELGLHEVEVAVRATSGHHSSIPIPCDSDEHRPFLLKFFVPPADAKFYPAGVNVDDYARRESAFYRFLDVIDPERRMVPAPRTILIDGADPPRWILLERISPAVGPRAEVLGMDHMFQLLEQIRSVRPDALLGRRNFPLSRWDPVSYLDRVRLMYDPVVYVIGGRRWSQVMSFYQEALRWIESRAHVMVHGDFTEPNILVDENGRPYLLDFERVGIGNEDHDFAWMWIHADRSHDWKRRFVARYFEHRVGSARIIGEWGVRSTLVYLALRRLRFGHLAYGPDDEQVNPNLALLDAALMGGADLFPS
jgi:hypothetical protein